MDIEIIKDLARLARVYMTEEEMVEIGNSFGSILDYVGQIKEVSGDIHHDYVQSPDEPINIYREDIVTVQSGFYNEKILSQAPAT